MTRQQQLLHLLADAPATSGELAAITGWKHSTVAAHLCNLRALGLVTGGGPRGHQHVPALWRLSDAQV